MIELRMGFFFTPIVWPNGIELPAVSMGLFAPHDAKELDAAFERYWEARKQGSRHSR